MGKYRDVILETGLFEFIIKYVHTTSLFQKKSLLPVYNWELTYMSIMSGVGCHWQRNLLGLVDTKHILITATIYFFLDVAINWTSLNK